MIRRTTRGIFPTDEIVAGFTRYVICWLLNGLRSHCNNRAREALRFVDYAFVCNEQDIPVHKVIVCSQSKAFDAACNGSFKKAAEKFVISDYSLEVVQRMVDYLYTGDYETGDEFVSEVPEQKAEAAQLNALEIHAIMFAMADEYLIDGLQIVSANKYWTTLANERNLFTFFASISNIYTLTPSHNRTLRDKAIQFVREKLPTEISSPEVKEAYEKVSKAIPEFTQDLVNSFLKAPLLGACSSCGNGVDIEVLQCRCLKCGKGGANAIFNKRKRSIWDM
jgi:speckle-type POZ protein